MSSPLPNQPTKYTGTQQPLVPTVTVNRAPTGADIRNPKTGKLYPIATIWQVGKNPTTGSEGDLYFLSKIVANVATWFPLDSNLTFGTFITDSGISPVVGSTITMTGESIEPAGTTIEAIRSFGAGPSTLAYRLQYAGESGGAPAAGQYGVSQFDSTSFSVVDGFVTLNNAPMGPLTSIQGNDAIVTSPISGVVELLGVVVPSATYALPVYVRQLTGNTEQIAVQVSADSVTSNSDLNGLCHFDSAFFSVDPDGFVSITGSSLGILTITGDAGTAVGPDNANINLSGATTTWVQGDPGNSNLSIEVVADDHAFLIGRGATTPCDSLGPLTNGQLIIGSTGNDPALATLIAGSGITITNGPGSIQISSSSTGLSWQTISTSQTLAVNNGYICVSGGALSLALPSTSSVGDVIEITLDGSTSFAVTQGAGQQIRFGAAQTTLGASGSLTTNAQGDALRLVCSVADTKWNIVSAMGNFTVV